MNQALFRRCGASFPLAACYRIAWLAALCMVWGPVSEVAAQDCVAPNTNGVPRNLAICGPADANEGDSGTRTLTYTVEMSRTNGAGLVQGLICFSGTANINTMKNGWSPDADYRLLNRDGTASGSACGFAELPKGTTKTTLDIEVRGDADGEPNDTVIATYAILGGGGASHVTLVTSTHTHTILNDDGTALPEISIAPEASSVTEGAAANFTVTASPAPTAPLTVNLIVSESDDFAISGETGSSKTVSIPTSGSATYAVSTDDDNTDEEDGSVTVNLNSGTGYTMGNTNSATVDVNDNDLPEANFEASTSSAAEDAGTHNIALSLISERTVSVTVNYTLSGTATLDTDYSIIRATGNSGSIRVGGGGKTGWGTDYAKSGTITIGASTTANIPVEITDDSVVEGDETVILTLASGTGYDVGTAITMHTLTITDEAPSTPEANFAASTSSATEDAGTQNIVVNLSPVPTGNVTVNYTLSGTALRGTDYTISGVSSNSGTITVGTSGTADIPVEITDDSAVEGDETVILTLGSGTGYDIGTTTTTHTLTITNNDTPEANFAASTSSAAEDAGTQNIAVNLSPVPLGNVTVNYTLSGDALRGTDYTISGVSSSSGTITVGTSGTANIPVVITDDSVVEESEEVILTLNSGTGYDVGTTTTTHTLTITNNDTPEANFAAPTSSAAEDADTQNIVVNLSPVPIGDVTVNYTLSGDATLDTDYTIVGVGSNSGTITVGTSGTADIPVVIIDDSVVESSETVILTLGSGTGYDVGATTTTHTLTITDNETPSTPEANFAASTSSAAEDAGTQNIVVNLSPVPTGNVTVNYTLSGNATRGTDYSISGVSSNSGTITVGTSGTANIPVVITDDSAVEGDETVILTLGSGTGYDVGTTTTTHTLTISDNDTPVANFAGSASSAAEDAGTQNIVVNLSPVPTGNVTVNYTLSGTALRGTDYSISGVSSSSGTITVGTSGTANIPVMIMDDSAVEESETVILTLASGTGYNVGTTTTTHTLTISDNDVPEANFAGSASSAAEDAGTHNIAVNLSPVPTGDVTVNYTLSGNATRDTDYTISGVSSSSGTITVGTSGTANIPVMIMDDSAVEESETVILTLASGTGYDVGTTTTTHTLTISDNDRTGTPEVTITGGSAVTEGGEASFTIWSNPAPSSSITVSYTVSQSGTFVASGQLGDKTQSISAASTTFAIPTEDDTLEEAGGSVMVTLTTGTGYDVGAPSAATVNVNDDDAPTPPATPAASFASASGSVSEGAGTHNVAVNVNPAPSAAITLNYSVAGTATEGADYSISSSGTVSVSAGQSSVNIPMALADDSEVEGSETVILTLGSGTGYDVGSAGVHTLTITDNDGGGVGVGGGGGGVGVGDVDISRVTLSVSPNPVPEGEEVTVTVSLTRVPFGDVTVPLVFDEGTAEEGDYGAPASIVIGANEPNAKGVIATVADDDLEDETFLVSLGALPAGFAAGTQASVEVTIEDHSDVTSIESFGDEVPEAFALDQNYPNPFNPSTAIEYTLSTPQHVRLEVFDAAGRSIGVLVDGMRPAGTHTVRFGADDLPSGLYVYRIQAGEQTMVRKMTLVR